MGIAGSSPVTIGSLFLECADQYFFSLSDWLCSSQILTRKQESWFTFNFLKNQSISELAFRTNIGLFHCVAQILIIWHWSVKSMVSKLLIKVGTFFGFRKNIFQSWQDSNLQSPHTCYIFSRISQYFRSLKLWWNCS